MALELPNIFATNMVLQRDLPIQVWGTADANSIVTVAFAGQSATAKADSNGKWKLTLKARPANSAPQTMTVTGDGKTVTYDNVVIGEVWVCSGQSNMAFGLKGADNADKAIPAATDKLIRLCTVGRMISEEPQDNAKITWDECSPEKAPPFTAVGYFFGKMLREKLDVPVGLIHTNWGGTPAEAWTSSKTLTSVPELKDIIPNAEKAVEAYPAQKEKWDKAMEAHKAKAAKWVAENPGKTAKDYKVRAPRAPAAPGKNPRYPSVLFNAMINPLIPYTIRGAIWYQGEANSGRPDEYRVLLPAMIKDWRTLWNQGDFAFGVVQLANFHATSTNPTDSGWTHLQNAQLYTSLTVPNTGMAVINDIGDARDIHPKNKQDVGNRLALWALHDVYKTINANWSGPLYDSYKVNGNKIVMTFTRVDGKLVTRDGKAPDEFTICGADHKWVRAQAKITGTNTVEVWADGVNEPVAARYAWFDNPVNPNLTDASGLPTSCSRTDDWPYKK
jgi:sialate O-acetylesterase